MRQKIPSRRRHHERGQTILLVAISMVSLLAMAALAIDIVTLYVARSEIQRAADAAALAAAKAIADSGVTSLEAGDANLPAAQLLAQNMATSAVTALVNSSSTLNLVAGTPPTLVTVTPIPIDFTRQGNPHVTITLQRTSLPTFFSKVWGASAPSVTATATAEAYNPANLASFTPIAPLSLKPWLVANADPNNASAAFVNITTGAVEASVTGEQLNLIADCRNAPPNKCMLRSGHNPPKANPPVEVDYVPLEVSSPPNSKNVCPGASAYCSAGPNDYEESIECADATTYVTPTCGGGATNAVWSDAFNPRGIAGLSATGTECLIHAGGPGPWDGSTNFQDILTVPGWPTNAQQIRAETGPQSGNLVTTSSSIVTIPIIDITSALPASPGAVTVVGYIQGFINQINPNPGTPTLPQGDINVTVLNIAGCSNSPNTAAAVVGDSGTSPVPVRLITPP
jgi:hypothetical protein